MTQADGEVSMTIARDPALVRTVRLVAAAVARRVERSDSVIEEIRLAVGEACGLMIGAETDGAVTDDRVSVQIRAGKRYEVAITGRVAPENAEFGDLGLDPFALIRGLSENLKVTQDDGRTTLRMSWPG